MIKVIGGQEGVCPISPPRSENSLFFLFLIIYVFLMLFSLYMPHLICSNINFS